MQASSSFTPSDASPLKILVKGLTFFEKRLLDGVVKLFANRHPALQLVDQHSDQPDVVIIDGSDADALSWSEQQKTWLEAKPVIWIDTPKVTDKHTSLQRPVQWTNLPIVIVRAIDNAETQDELKNEVVQTARQDVRLSSPSTQSADASNKAVPILVVDDSLAVRSHLESVLNVNGYVVTTACDGEEAVEAMKTGHFACVLMDVLMPGMDGYEACRHIKGQQHAGVASTPIVMLTSRSSPFDKIRGKMAGCNAYLTKPVQKSNLFQVLKEQTDHYRAAQNAQVQHSSLDVRRPKKLGFA